VIILIDNWLLPLYKIYSDDEDLSLITKVIKRGHSWAIGPEIEEFENAISKLVGVDYCACMNSGTSALHAVLLAYGVGSSDEVITSSFSFISTANSILFVNSKPIFADIEDTAFGLDPASVSKKITSSTRVILPMDYGGQSCQISELKKISNENNVLLIEDAAEGLGSSINGKMVGSQSDASIFSFCGNKVLTTGEGGAVVTNSKQVYEKIKLIRSHGRVDPINYFDNPSQNEYIDIGYNWRMSSLTASLGITQIQKLSKIIKMRQENAKYLSSHLSRHEKITVPKILKNSDHIFQLYTIRLPEKKIRDDLHDFLTKRRIFSKVYFSPIHLTSFYKKKFGTQKGDLPKTEEISDQVLTLPLYPNMTKEEKELLINTISEFFESDNK